MAKDAQRADVEWDPLVDINVVAARLGVEVRHIRRLVHERRIPYVKWGHLLRFDPTEIDAWLEAARRPVPHPEARIESGPLLTTPRCRIRHHEEVDSRATPAAISQLVSSARRRAGLTQRALAARAGTSQAAIARYESGRHVPDLRTLTRLVAACGLELSLDVRPANATGQRDGRSGSESALVRPVAVPDDVDDPAIAKACGIVELPERIRWSGPRQSYDLSDRQDRARVYEQILREGTDDDVRRFIRLDELADLWDDLVVPAHVRDAWELKLQGQGRKSN